MKTITQSNSVQISRSLSSYRKLNNHIIQPIKAGFIGFMVVLMIIFFIDLLSYIMTSGEKSKLDLLDLSLGGVGFVLQFCESLLRSFSG
jgi:hypothetical protein